MTDRKIDMEEKKDKWDRMTQKERGEYLDNMIATGQTVNRETRHYMKKYFLGLFPYWREIN